MFRKIVEYFIPSQTGRTTEYRRRLKLIAYAISVTMLFAFFYIAVSWIAGYIIGLLIMLGSWLCYLTLLIMLKNGLDVFKVANIFGFIGTLSIYASIYFSGGFQSPVLPWLASTPIVLLLIAGKKSGSYWAGVSVLGVIFFGLMNYYGYQFPKLYNLSRETYFAISCQTGLVLIIFFISIVFENIRVTAFNQVNEQKNTLENTLAELKVTQTQLIQSEKMASLGELTAGIAHEIQNPLNFVTNFSEVSNELIDEMNEELDKGEVAEAKSIGGDIKQNLEKINHHGQRASSIVKGMLEHSRSSDGKKELTDINVLADEYLRLSYHGLRAKDKTFNAGFKTDFDGTLPKINIVPQDIGRVLLNLINNAFYACNEKQKEVKDLSGFQNLTDLDSSDESAAETEDSKYKPMVIVSTKFYSSLGIGGGKGNEKIEIKIKDNGSGIPPKVLEKIFQPFFTTKPAGQGTGLGLSMSYDIVTKAHGGELRAESKVGESSIFTILLPSDREIEG